MVTTYLNYFMIPTLFKLELYFRNKKHHNHNNIIYVHSSYLSLKLHCRDFQIKRYYARRLIKYYSHLIFFFIYAIIQNLIFEIVEHILRPYTIIYHISILNNYSITN